MLFRIQTNENDKKCSWADNYVGLIFSPLNENKDKIYSPKYYTLKGLKSAKEKFEFWKNLSEEEKEKLIVEDRNLNGNQ